MSDASHRPGAPHVAMFVRNLFKHDARVTREALTLIENGFNVTVFAVAAKEEDAGEDWAGPIRVVRYTLKTPVWRFAELMLTATRGYYRFARALRRFGPVALYRRLARSLFLYRRKGSFVLRLPREQARAVPGGFPTRLLTGPLWHLGAPLRRRGQLPAGAELPPPSRPPARKPLGVEAADRTRRRIRTFLMPSHRFLQAIKFGRLAGRAAATLEPVAFHCHDLNSILAGAIGRRIHPAPMIYDSHELWPHRNRPDKRRRKTWIVEKGDRFWSRRADAVITVNDSIADHMTRRYGLRTVNVIRNVPAISKQVEREGDSILDATERPALLYVGGIQSNRGLEELIAAMSDIPHGTLIAIGPGQDQYRHTLEKLARDLGVADRVEFPGLIPHERLIATMRGADIGFALIKNYCLSYYLSLPNKFSEYVHAGVPIVASNFPEMQRLIDHYEIGIACDPEDPKDIAKAVCDLLDRPADLLRMRENMPRAAQELNWEGEQTKLITLYRDLVLDGSWPKAGVR